VRQRPPATHRRQHEATRFERAMRRVATTNRGWCHDVPLKWRRLSPS
jgi:hypothetical protein